MSKQNKDWMHDDGNSKPANWDDNEDSKSEY